MRTKLYFILSCVLLSGVVGAQAQRTVSENASERPFNNTYWSGVADKRQLRGAERVEFMELQKRLHESREPHRQFHDSELVWVTVENGRLGGASTFTAGCANADFESNNFSGWVRKTGLHPLYNSNTVGCCPNANGAQAIMSGTGLDPYGAFPVVAPGGSYSARLGNNQVNGVADRLEYTFSVTPQNVNFTYRYAVVLNDQNHPVAEQPGLTIEMLDTTGFQVPCTFYTVAANASLVSTGAFFTSSVTGGNPLAPVYYKPWTTVALDLTPSLGQVVTLRFTTYDCSQGGHFGYAYIDATCGSFETSSADTTCPGVPYTMCAPSGFMSYYWTGPSSFTSNARCVNVTQAGTYSCQTVISTNCPGPTFNHTLTLRPKPVVSFTPVTNGPCALQYTFNASASISGGSVASYFWNFGDNTAGSVLIPAHNYTAPGTYPVKFKAISDKGCADSVSQSVIIYPFPNLSFSPPSNCVNTAVQFTNTSVITGTPVNSISSYTWNLGNGVFSNSMHPVNSYSASGPYSVQLSATSNQGCVSSLTSTLGIFPPPLVTFTAANFCFNDATVFTPSTSISSGSLVAFRWTFGDGTSSTVNLPAHTYTSSGSYVVSFSATSNHNCVASENKTITIHPLPVAAFISNSVCLNSSATSFSSTSQEPFFPYSISSYTWNFGNGNLSGSTSPTFNYTVAGAHVASLTVQNNVGCFASTTNTVRVYPLPNISFNPPSACVNTAIQFTNTTQILAPSTIVSYSWNFGNGVTTTSTNPVYSYTAASPYTIVLQAISNHNCGATSTTTLDIYPNPTASFVVANNCLGTATSFSNASTVTHNGTIPFFNWNFGNSGSSSQISPVLSYSSSGTFTVTLVATSNRGCSDTYSTTITIHPIPLVGLSTNSVCPGITSIFNANYTISPGSVTTNTWSFGDGGQAFNTTSPGHTYMAPGNYTVTHNATSSQGCVSSGSAITVVYPQPVINFSPAGACVGTAINFTNTSSIAYGSIPSYTWNFGNGNISYSANPTFSYNVSQNYLVQLSATSNHGCITTSTVNLPIYPAAATDFSFANICHGSTSSFSAISSVSSGSVMFYNWNLGNGYLGTTPTLSLVYANPGTYTVTLSATTNSGCVSTAVKSVTIFPAPVTSFTAPAVCFGNATQFTNNTTIQGAPANTVSSWQWDFGDNTAIDPFQAPGHTYTTTNNGSYSYTVSLTATSNQGCVNTASSVVNTYPLPIISFSPASACVNTAIQFTNNTGIPLGSITGYTWHLGNNITSNQIQPVHSYTTHGNNTVTLTAVSNAGCYNTGFSSLDIFPYPQVAVTPSVNSCVNESAAFMPNVIYSGFSNSGVTSYTWNFGNSTYSVINSPTTSTTITTYSSYGTFTVVLSVNTSANCKSVDSTVITIYPKPMPSFVSQNFCHRDSTSFINTSSIQSGTITSHLWYFNDGISSSTMMHPKYVFSSPKTYTVVLKETSNPEPGVSCEQSYAGTVAINPLPQPAFTHTNACDGSLVQLSNSAPTLNVVSFGWDFDNDGQTDAASPNAAHQFPAPGVYTVNLSTGNTFSCTSTVSRTVQVYANPTASFTGNNVCFRRMTTFTNVSAPGDGNFKYYKWSFAGQDSSSLGAPQYSFTSPGIHTVQLTVISGIGPSLECKAKYTNTVEVYHLPVAQFTNNSVCEGILTSFQNLSYIADGSPLRFRWDYMSNGFDDSTTTNAIAPFRYPNSGGFNFKLEAISDKGCQDSRSGLVVVYANPKANFMPTKICVGDNIVFTNLSTSADGSVTSHVWDMNGDHIPDKNDEHPSYTYTLNGDYTAQLTVITQHGCSNSRSKPIFANPKAVPGYRYDKASGCPPLTVNFENLSTIASGSFSTSWNFGDLSPATVNNDPTHVFTNSGSFNLRLELVSDSGCVSVLEHLGSVTVFEKPVAAFRINPDEVDEDEPTITVTSLAGNGMAETRYFINDGAMFFTPDFEYSLKNITGGSKPLIVQIVRNEAGCSDTAYDIIRIRPAFTLYFPDAFSPNGDQVNDDFFAKGVGIVDFDMQIYDSWGHVVFVADHVTQRWDGRSKDNAEPVKQDVYTWKARVLDVHNKRHDLVGHVTVIK